MFQSQAKIERKATQWLRLLKLGLKQVQPWRKWCTNINVDVVKTTRWRQHVLCIRAAAC